ncbi:MATE family efflux transporter [Sedimentibacter saalensis]|jgi:putative MATE family efflux protein|uniref:MATE family efflux transporter n=1 Tax=Sedimentibacter saalensis TaxID=130788 RepID=UPI00289B4CC6|nr:MATE family efflux transporter [Sedimentibacter saalensis]MEA5096206.1 MATE family efflux transporter [Sedimentibacter saalensis]
MSKNLDLKEGKIRSTLVKLALPIMGTSFIHMAYNLTDIMWLGRLSTGAVAAAGTAGFFLWFGSSLVMITQVGVGVNVAQYIGRNDSESAKKYITNGFQLDIFIALLYSLFLFSFRHNIIGFFNLQDSDVIQMAIEYLTIISMGIIFHFLNPIFSAALNSTGNSITPFKINTIGLVANIILDPLLIFGVGPLPQLGIKGAALATIMSQFVVTILFVILGKAFNNIYSHVSLLSKPDMQIVKSIMKLGVPPFLQTGLHAVINMILTKIIAQFGPVAVAVQSIGSQIESISWMTSEGFSSSISAFVGQNYGAKKLERIKEGYKQGIQILGSIGIFTSLLLIFAAKFLFAIFVPNDPIAINEGVIYLRILGLSQFFMCIEIGTIGAFNGLGKTLQPTVNGVVLNVLRIPFALILSSTVLGLSGVWWSISISSILKGIILFIWFRFVLAKLKV